MILEPLIGDMPLVGALSIFFLRKPVSTQLFHDVVSVCLPSLGSDMETQMDKEEEQILS